MRNVVPVIVGVLMTSLPAFAAVETYPDLSQSEDATSAARPGFWEAWGFTLVIDDPQFPVMRRELA